MEFTSTREIRVVLIDCTKYPDYNDGLVYLDQHVPLSDAVDVLSADGEPEVKYSEAINILEGETFTGISGSYGTPASLALDTESYGSLLPNKSLSSLHDKNGTEMLVMPAPSDGTLVTVKAEPPDMQDNVSNTLTLPSTCFHQLRNDNIGYDGCAEAALVASHGNAVIEDMMRNTDKACSSTSSSFGMHLTSFDEAEMNLTNKNSISHTKSLGVRHGRQKRKSSDKVTAKANKLGRTSKLSVKLKACEDEGRQAVLLKTSGRPKELTCKFCLIHKTRFPGWMAYHTTICPANPNRKQRKIFTCYFCLKYTASYPSTMAIHHNRCSVRMAGKAKDTRGSPSMKDALTCEFCSTHRTKFPGWMAYHTTICPANPNRKQRKIFTCYFCLKYTASYPSTMAIHHNRCSVRMAGKAKDTRGSPSMKDALTCEFCSTHRTKFPGWMAYHTTVCPANPNRKQRKIFTCYFCLKYTASYPSTMAIHHNRCSVRMAGKAKDTLGSPSIKNALTCEFCLSHTTKNRGQVAVHHSMCPANPNKKQNPNRKKITCKYCLQHTEIHPSNMARHQKRCSIKTAGKGKDFPDSPHSSASSIDRTSQTIPQNKLSTYSACQCCSISIFTNNRKKHDRVCNAKNYEKFVRLGWLVCENCFTFKSKSPGAFGIHIADCQTKSYGQRTANCSDGAKIPQLRLPQLTLSDLNSVVKREQITGMGLRDETRTYAKTGNR